MGFGEPGSVHVFEVRVWGSWGESLYFNDSVHLSLRLGSHLSPGPKLSPQQLVQIM